MELLSEIVGQDETGQLTKSLCLTSGCAKRLLSMFLCLPGDHVVRTHSQYLLTLANDAVRRHISLLRLVNKPEFEGRKSGIFASDLFLRERRNHNSFTSAIQFIKLLFILQQLDNNYMTARCLGD